MKRQGGISLVEIMVALVLSLFLSAGVIEVYLASKQSYKTQEGYSRLQENGRFAMETLTRFIRLAGYKPYDAVANAFPADSAIFPADTTFTVAGQVVAGTDGGGGASDSISFRYQDDGALGDCYNSTGADKPRTISFSVDLDRNLDCTATVDGTTYSEGIVEGVENLQILYGVDTDAPGDGYANQYRDAGAVTAGNQWAAVVSVRIGLIMSTVENVSSQADDASFTLLGTAITAPGATDATRFMRRHPFTATINIRNRTP